MQKCIFHHFLMTGKVREMGCSVPHGHQWKVFHSWWFCPRKWGLLAEAFIGIGRQDLSVRTDEAWAWGWPWMPFASWDAHCQSQKVAGDPEVKLQLHPQTWLERYGKIKRFWMSMNPVYKAHALCCVGKVLRPQPVSYTIHKENKHYAKCISFFWIPTLQVYSIGKPFNEYFLNSLDCSFVTDNTVEKNDEQKPGIRFRS